MHAWGIKYALIIAALSERPQKGHQVLVNFATESLQSINLLLEFCHVLLLELFDGEKSTCYVDLGRVKDLVVSRMKHEIHGVEKTRRKVQGQLSPIPKLRGIHGKVDGS